MENEKASVTLVVSNKQLGRHTLGLKDQAENKAACFVAVASKVTWDANLFSLSLIAIHRGEGKYQ